MLDPNRVRERDMLRYIGVGDFRAFVDGLSLLSAGFRGSCPREPNTAWALQSSTGARRKPVGDERGSATATVVPRCPGWSKSGVGSLGQRNSRESEMVDENSL